MFLSAINGWLSNIGDAFLDVFYQILWGILTGILQLLDGIVDAFYFLTGVENLSIVVDGQEVEMSLLELLFGISNNGLSWDFSSTVHKVYIGMLGVFAVVFVFCIVCAVIKINMNRQAQETLPSMKKMLYKSGQAFFITILLPVIFMALLSLSAIFIRTIIDILQSKLFDDDLLLSECIFRACVSGDVLENYETMNKSVTWAIFEGSGKYKVFSEAKTWDMIKQEFGETSVNLFTLTVAVCACLVGVGFSALTVAERLINIFLLYIIAPFVCASIPLDDGKRWESWKDITTVKILTAAVNVLSIYIFIYIITTLGKSILVSTVPLAVRIMFLLVTIAGAFCSAKASTLLASIISANQGQQEGMSFAATRAMTGAAAKLAGLAIGGAGLLAYGKTRGQKNQTSTNTNGGGGGILPTSHTPDNTNPADNFNAQKMVQSGGATPGQTPSNSTLASPGNTGGTVPNLARSRQNSGGGTTGGTNIQPTGTGGNGDVTNKGGVIGSIGKGISKGWNYLAQNGLIGTIKNGLNKGQAKNVKKSAKLGTGVAIGAATVGGMAGAAAIGLGAVVAGAGVGIIAGIAGIKAAKKGIKALKNKRQQYNAKAGVISKKEALDMGANFKNKDEKQAWKDHNKQAKASYKAQEKANRTKEKAERMVAKADKAMLKQDQKIDKLQAKKEQGRGGSKIDKKIEQANINKLKKGAKLGQAVFTRNRKGDSARVKGNEANAKRLEAKDNFKNTISKNMERDFERVMKNRNLGVPPKNEDKLHKTSDYKKENVSEATKAQTEFNNKKEQEKQTTTGRRRKRQPNGDTDETKIKKGNGSDLNSDSTKTDSTKKTNTTDTKYEKKDGHGSQSELDKKKDALQEKMKGNNKNETNEKEGDE